MTQALSELSGQVKMLQVDKVCVVGGVDLVGSGWGTVGCGAVHTPTQFPSMAAS